jgi:hypothetical protein
MRRRFTGGNLCLASALFMIAGLKGERATLDSCLRRGAMIAERARLTAAARIT